MTEEKAMKQISPELKLLDLTLKNASAIQSSTMGEFTTAGAQEILLVRPGGAIEVYKIESSDNDNDNDDDDEDDEEEESRTWLKMVMRVETRSVIRSMEIVRFREESRDLVIIGSDSGNVSVMDLEGGQAKILHCPAFGKTGEYELYYGILYLYPILSCTVNDIRSCCALYLHLYIFSL